MSNYYGYGYMIVTLDKFLKCAMEVKPTDTDRDDKEHSIWLVPKTFSGMLFVKSATYSSVEVSQARSSLRLNNVPVAPLANSNYTI